MKLQHCLASLCLALAPTLALAEPVQGLYVSLGGGMNWTDSPLEKTSHADNFTGAAGAAGFQLDLLNSGNISTKTGFGILGTVGYGFPFNVRVELEVAHRVNSLNQFEPAPTTPIGLKFSGQERKTSIMANVLYDFNNFAKSATLPITPYVGAGVGISIVDWSNASRSGGPLNFGPGLGVATTVSSIFNTSDVVFAAQAIAGFSYDIASVPGLSFTTDFRIHVLPGGFAQRGVLTLGSAPSFAFGTTTSTSAHTYDAQWNYGVMFGLRYAFGATAPAPAPVPVPVAAAATARSYLVFFDWDKANLTDRARTIVAEAAQASTKVQTTRIEVNGYTDTSGTPAYNQGLSIRRAQAVAAELVKDGVSKSAIAIHGFGETHLLVPTGPNVREPQNRRIEIVIK